MVRFYFGLIFLSGCVNSSDRKRELDSLLLGEDSVRMTTSIAKPLININEIKPTNDPNIDFARLMRQYYSEALKGAEIELNKGKHPEAVAIAKDQLKHHTKDIEWLDAYLHQHRPSVNDPKFFKQFVLKLQKRDIKPVQSKDFDIQFLELVVKHHQEATLLTEVYEEFASDSILLSRVKATVDAHKPEIVMLQKLVHRLQTKQGI
jgi:uncharacterized protein (DUF305 family)